jgi:hypothetical protein
MKKQIFAIITLVMISFVEVGGQYGPLAHLPVSFIDPETFEFDGDLTEDRAIGDFNMDGIDDHVVFNSAQIGTGERILEVYLGRNNRTLQRSFSLRTFFGSIGVADFNHDSRPDIVLLHLDAPDLQSVSQLKVMTLLGNGDGTFQEVSDTPVANKLDPEPVAVGDFNGDGKLDVAMIGGNIDSQGFIRSGGLFVLFGKGDGTFQPLGTISMGYVAEDHNISLAVGDINDDGLEDLVYGLSQYGSYIYLGNADGTFVQRRSDAQHVVVGDFNGDGHLDLASSGVYIDPNISIWLGIGDGTFQEPVIYDSGFDERGGIAVKDMDHDGRQDLVVSGQDGRSGLGGVSILYGNGDGTFQSRALFLTGQPSYPLVGDFDGDGIFDIDIGGDVRDTIIFGSGDRKFRLPLVLPSAVITGGPPFNHHVGIGKMAVADFNHDGHQDIAAIELNRICNIAIWLGNGDGTFRTPSRIEVNGDSPDSLVVGDFNNDGSFDVIVGDSRNYYHQTTPLFLLLGNGDGTLKTANSNIIFGASFAQVYDLQGGDFNDDGKPDLIASLGSFIFVLLGNGDGTFNSSTLSSPFELAPGISHDFRATAIAVGDLNNDSIPDVAMALDHPYDSTVAFGSWMGNGDGTFRTVSNFHNVVGPEFGGEYASLILADFDRSGLLDVLLSKVKSNEGFASESVLFGNTMGLPWALREVTLHNGPPLNAPMPAFTKTADFDGDGLPEVVGIDANTNNVYLLTGHSDWLSTASALFSIARPIRAYASDVGDFNEDGKPDLAIGCGFGVSILINDTGCTALDISAPIITGASVDKPVLWPPNHQMINVTVGYNVSDNCTPRSAITSKLSVTSNELDNGLGDGDTPNDIVVLDAHNVRLRAERGPTGNGRVYAITVTSTDIAGNASSKIITVSVPRNF